MKSNYTYNSVDKSWINSNGKVDIQNLLYTNYGGIPDILEENMFLQKDECDIFYELTFNDTLVGFATYDIIDEKHYVLTSFYVKSDELLQSLFINHLKSHYQQGHILSIWEPTRKIIELLIKCEFAVELNKSLVISAINFQLNSSSLKSTDESKIKLDKNDYFTNLYDMDMCMLLSLNIYNINNYTCYYTQLQDVDKIHYTPINTRKQLDKSYFDNMVSYIIDNDEIIEKRLFFLRNNIHKTLNDKDITNTLIKITQSLDKLRDKHQITNDKYNRIQEQLINELNVKDVYPESIDLRIEYLLRHIDDETTKDYHGINICPYCKEELDPTEIYCTTCGYVYIDVDDIDMDKLDEIIYFNTFMEKMSYKYSLYNKKEKKRSFDEEYLIKLAVYALLNSLKIEEFSEQLYDTIKYEYNIEDFNLKEYIEEKEYISYTLDKNSWQKIAPSYKVAQLKEILKAFKQKTSGKKAELIDRITDNIPLEYIKTGNPNITTKGLKYLEDNVKLILYSNYLEDYILDEYLQYCKENPDEEIEQIIAFLDEHIDYAIYTKNHHHLTNTLVTQAVLYSEKEDYQSALQLTLQRFIIDLNMIYIKEEFIPYNIPIQQSTAQNMYSLNQLMGHKNFKNTFKQIYKTFKEDNLRLSYDETYEIISQLLINTNLNRLNTIIINTYYMDKKVQKPPKHKEDITRKTTLDDYF